jgi:hypothetical protein
MIPLPGWMQKALYATAVMNAFGALLFLPPAQPARALIGLPEAPTLYLVMVGMFVALFGVGYLWTAMAGRADRMFIVLGAAGKLGFFTTVTVLWLAGQLSVLGPLFASGDLVFGVMFVAWLAGVSPAPVAHASAASAR